MFVTCLLVEILELLKGMIKSQLSQLSVSNMAVNDKMNMIIHITSPDPQSLQARLEENELFKKYYDGCEMSMGRALLSTRYYYYQITPEDLHIMTAHIEAVREGHRIQIKITKDGNFDFD